jgi:hypothetical protein
MFSFRNIRDNQIVSAVHQQAAGRSLLPSRAAPVPKSGSAGPLHVSISFRSGYNRTAGSVTTGIPGVADAQRSGGTVSASEQRGSTGTGCCESAAGRGVRPSGVGLLTTVPGRNRRPLARCASGEGPVCAAICARRMSGVKQD